MSVQDRRSGASVRDSVKLAAVREALRRETPADDPVEALTELIDALDSYRSETAMRAAMS